MSQRLEGRIAAVTGGGRGIGFGTALRLAREGAVVIILEQDKGLMEQAVADLKAEGLSAHGFAVDISDAPAVDATFKTIAQTIGPPAILANVAGICPFAAVEAIGADEWHRVVAVNLTGTLLCCQAVIPHMKRAGFGRIVNTASGVFRDGTLGAPHYVATKGGVIGLTRALATELGAFGITCNAVSPGPIATEATASLMNDGSGMTELMKNLLAKQAIKRIGQPSDVAAAMAFLASDDAGFITGQTVEVNGGFVYG
ncbi:SDR family NAD(P)-dependent oxidoreductase [Sphingobium sp.]|uniref:SDR family NAD(P)-dependent oxidoreductase n=1 Tax=Sphingobium sp. TaxID=1912891 RepID=UPI0028BDBA8A|nr:SDR family NAD(P)-dependent oxidoreductase [Sphingobium sp.]